MQNTTHSPLKYYPRIRNTSNKDFLFAVFDIKAKETFIYNA